MMVFWGVWGVQGGSGEVWGGLGGGVCFTPVGHFSPSGSLVQHQIWFQTPHIGPTGQCLLARHHWPISGLLVPYWGLSKWSPFGTLKSLKIPYIESKRHFASGDHPQCIILHLVPSLDILGHLMTFSGAKRLISGQLGAPKGLVLLIKWLFWSP